MLFPGLSSLVIEEVVASVSVLQLTARSAMASARCPRCGTESRRVHAWHLRRLADLPVGGRPAVMELRIRRLLCIDLECPQRTFREQIPALASRYARRTLRLATTIGQVAVTLAGRAGAALLAALGVSVSRSSLLRALMALPLPTTPTPPVLSVDDVALRRGCRYMTMVIDPVTHRRIDVLPDRRAATLAAWLRDRPGVTAVCRDGSATYAEAITAGAPDAVQVSDRWHLWHGLGRAVEKVVIAHTACWRPDTAPAPITTAGTRPESALAQRTRARHAAVHALLDQGVGLLECSRRLGWSLNTIKRYARAARAEELIRPPRYGTTLVDPHRDHLRRRLAADPNVATTQLLAEIRECGYTVRRKCPDRGRAARRRRPAHRDRTHPRPPRPPRRPRRPHRPPTRPDRRRGRRRVADPRAAPGRTRRPRPPGRARRRRRARPADRVAEPDQRPVLPHPRGPPLRPRRRHLGRMDTSH